MANSIKASRIATSLFALLFALSGAELHADTSEATIVTPAGSALVATNQNLTFTSRSYDSAGSDLYVVNSYLWNFGDGTTAAVANVSHAYATAGTYTATLSVSYTRKTCSRMDVNENCTAYRIIGTGTASASRTITVKNPPKVTGFSATPSTVRAGMPVTLSWSTTNATSWSIPGVDTRSGSPVVVYPGTTTTYTLTAGSDVGSDSASTMASVYTVGVSIGQTSANLLLGESKKFSAVVSPANQGVSWSTNGGSMNGVIYTGTSPGTYSVTATSLEDPTKSASVTVSVASVSVNSPTPGNASVNAGSSLQFSAVVNGAANTGVIWSVSGGGSINSNGLFAASSAGAYRVTATSLADGSKQAGTNVTVTSVVTGVSITPPSISLKAGEKTTFTASASGLGGNNTAVTWSANGGSVDNSGVYSAPLQGGPYAVTATSVQDPSKSTSASVSVAAISVNTPMPDNGSVNAGSTLQFSAAVNGAADPRLTWTVSGGGSINASGLFSATTAGSFTVVATSVADASKQASTKVTVSSVVNQVNITPDFISLKAGEVTTFAASAVGVGGNNPAVTWSASGGSLKGNGVYKAPLQGGNYWVSATSVQNPTKSASSMVSVAFIGVITPSPANASVNAGSTLQFSSSVSGASDAGLSWSVSGGGSISVNGLFTAATAGTYVVTATSDSDSTKTASTKVTVTSVVTGLSVGPAAVALNAGEFQAFTASVSGLGGVSQAVAWTCSAGTITDSGAFTAPSQAGPITITATSIQDPTKTGTASVRVKGWALKWKKDIIYVGTKEIAEVDSQGLHVTMVDHLGSPRFLVNQAGTLEAEQKFLPYGESLATPAAAGLFAKGFTNHEQTDPSGLIYMQARFYAPWYGRFPSSPGREVMQAMLAVLSKFERDVVSERTAIAMAHLRSLGRYPGGFEPYGRCVESGGAEGVQGNHPVQISHRCPDLRICCSPD